MEVRIILLIIAVIVIFGGLIAFSKFSRSDVSGKERRMSRFSSIGAFIISIAIILGWFLDLTSIFGPNYYFGYFVLGFIGLIVFIIGLFQK